LITNSSKEIYNNQDKISCHFLPTSGSTGSKYVFKILFYRKIKIANNSTTIDAREKNKHRFEILEILDKFQIVTEF
jgi:hypothetical protein